MPRNSNREQLPAVLAPKRQFSSDPDYKVVMRVRNARMLGAMQRAGFHTVAALCRAIGAHQTNVGNLINLKASPYDRRGNPTPLMQKICDRIGGTIEDLFPPGFLQRAQALVEFTLDLTEEQIEGFLAQRSKTPEQWLLAAEAAGNISHTMVHLKPREERVLRLRHGFNVPEHTLEEIGEPLGVSRERVRQLERKGQRGLLNNACWQTLAEAAEVLSVGCFTIERVARQRARFGNETDERAYDIRLREKQRIEARRKPKPPSEEATLLRRPIRFPSSAPLEPEPVKQVDPDYIRLLRVPSASRSPEQKRALAYHLEEEFCRRGAGRLRVAVGHEADVAHLSPDDLMLAKYDWFITNLAAMWQRFPPAPDISP